MPKHHTRKFCDAQDKLQYCECQCVANRVLPPQKKSLMPPRRVAPKRRKKGKKGVKKGEEKRIPAGCETQSGTRLPYETPEPTCDSARWNDPKDSTSNNRR